jgi:hypothetical protein
VNDAQLTCIRADEIKHSGPIDVPMYEQLLNADVVVADLSTSNKNAYYELGVRHALRPYSTVIICEDGIKTFPFDVNHSLIQQYHHMGDGIDFGEVERFRKVLTEVIVAVFNQEPRPKDSPVYTFLNQLAPPALAKMIHEVAEAAVQSSPGASEAQPAAAPPGAKLYSDLMDEIDAAQKTGDFEEAKSLLKVLRKRMKPGPGLPEDPYIIQRLAFATYKVKYDTVDKEVAALKEARDLLAQLTPDTSNDTETLGMWGTVHKRLWDKAADAGALDTAIRSYGRGFALRNDHYNGVNVAFMLNVRATYAMAPTPSGPPAPAQLAAAIADYVLAQRTREEVASICDAWLASHPPPDDGASQRAKDEYIKAKYWMIATKAEAFLGMGRSAEAEAAYQEAYALAAEPWMIDTTKDQRAKLERLLANSPLQYVKA